jgi:hypothetical protein
MLQHLYSSEIVFKLDPMIPFSVLWETLLVFYPISRLPFLAMEL